MGNTTMRSLVAAHPSPLGNESDLAHAVPISATSECSMQSMLTMSSRPCRVEHGRLPQVRRRSRWNTYKTRETEEHDEDNVDDDAYASEEHDDGVRSHVYGTRLRSAKRKRSTLARQVESDVDMKKSKHMEPTAMPPEGGESSRSARRGGAAAVTINVGSNRGFNKGTLPRVAEATLPPIIFAEATMTTLDTTASLYEQTQASLRHWNHCVAPSIHKELTDKVNVRMHPLFEYVDARWNTTMVTSGAPAKKTNTVNMSAVADVRRYTLPIVLSLDTKGDMTQWLTAYGAALMVVRVASAAAGEYGQLTVNRMSQLTGVAVHDLSAIEKMHGPVSDTYAKQIDALVSYFMGPYHDWIAESSSIILRRIVQQRLGYVLSKQLHNAEHERRHKDIICTALQNVRYSGQQRGRTQNIHVLTHYNPRHAAHASASAKSTFAAAGTRPLKSQRAKSSAGSMPRGAISSSSNNNCGGTLPSAITLLNMPIRSYACEVVVVATAADSTQTTETRTTILGARASCPRRHHHHRHRSDTGDETDMNDEGTSLASSSLPLQQQQSHHHPYYMYRAGGRRVTSTRVVADVVVRLDEVTWVVIEAKFISDRTNAHNKTPRMIEAKRQCEAVRQPHWTFVYVAFVGGDWDISQLQTLQREGFCFVWEHDAPRLTTLVATTLASRIQSVRVPEHGDVEENATRHGDTDDENDDDHVAATRKKRRKIAQCGKQRERIRNKGGDDDDYDYGEA